MHKFNKQAQISYYFLAFLKIFFGRTVGTPSKITFSLILQQGQLQLQQQ